MPHYKTPVVPNKPLSLDREHPTASTHARTKKQPSGPGRRRRDHTVRYLVVDGRGYMVGRIQTVLGTGWVHGSRHNFFIIFISCCIITFNPSIRIWYTNVAIDIHPLRRLTPTTSFTPIRLFALHTGEIPGCVRVHHTREK